MKIGFENLKSAVGVEAQNHKGKSKKVDANLLLHGHDSAFQFPGATAMDPMRDASTSVDAWTNRKVNMENLLHTFDALFSKVAVREVISGWDGAASLLTPLLDHFLFAEKPPADWLRPESADNFITLNLKDSLDVQNAAVQQAVMHLISLRAAVHIRETLEASLNVGEVNVVPPQLNRKAPIPAGVDVALNWGQLMTACRLAVKKNLLANTKPPDAPPSTKASGVTLDTLVAECFAAAGGFSELVRLQILLNTGAGYDMPVRGLKAHRLSDQGKANDIHLALNHVRFILWMEWRAGYELLHSKAKAQASSSADDSGRDEKKGALDEKGEELDLGLGPRQRPVGTRGLALTREGRPTPALIKAYRDSIPNSTAYLSQAEGQVLAEAWGVTAQVFTQLHPAGDNKKNYVDTVTGNLYRESPLATLKDGHCLIHGMSMILHGRNAKPKEIGLARQLIAARLSGESIEAELASIIAEWATPGDFHAGVGERVAALLNRDAMALEMRDSASQGSSSSSSVKAKPLPSKPSSSGKGSPPEASKKGSAGAYLPAPQMGTLAPSITYGNGGRHGILMYVPGHYVVLQSLGKKLPKPGGLSAAQIVSLAAIGIVVVGGIVGWLANWW